MQKQQLAVLSLDSGWGPGSRQSQRAICSTPGADTGPAPCWPCNLEHISGLSGTQAGFLIHNLAKVIRVLYKLQEMRSSTQKQ